MRKQILFRNIYALNRNKPLMTTNDKSWSLIYRRLSFAKIYYGLMLKNYLNVISKIKISFIKTTEPLMQQDVSINFIRTTNLGNESNIDPKKASQSDYVAEQANIGKSQAEKLAVTQKQHNEQKKLQKPDHRPEQVPKKACYYSQAQRYSEGQTRYTEQEQDCWQQYTGQIPIKKEKSSKSLQNARNAISNATKTQYQKQSQLKTVLKQDKPFLSKTIKSPTKINSRQNTIEDVKKIQQDEKLERNLMTNWNNQSGQTNSQNQKKQSKEQGQYIYRQDVIITNQMSKVGPFNKKGTFQFSTFNKQIEDFVKKSVYQKIKDTVNQKILPKIMPKDVKKDKDQTISQQKINQQRKNSKYPHYHEEIKNPEDLKKPSQKSIKN